MHEVMTRTARAWLDERGIVHIDQVAGSEQTFTDADENVRAGVTLAAGTRRLLLVDMSRVKSISREARVRYAMPDNAQSAIALAVVVGNPLSRMIGNFFIGMNRAPMPTRLFGKHSEAIAWLVAQPDPTTR